MRDIYGLAAMQTVLNTYFFILQPNNLSRFPNRLNISVFLLKMKCSVQDEIPTLNYFWVPVVSIVIGSYFIAR